MPNYTCSTCGKIFNDKFNYTTHLKRKFPCKPKSNINQNESLRNQNEIQNTKEYKCGYCGKNFSTNSNWNRHVKEYCKIKNEKVMEENTIFGQLKNEMEKQKEQINKQNNEMNILKDKLNENELLKKQNDELQFIVNNALLNDKQIIYSVKHSKPKKSHLVCTTDISSSSNSLQPFMNQPSIFTFNDKTFVYVADKKGIIWFNGKEVVSFIGYKNHREAIHEHIKKKYITTFEEIDRGSETLPLDHNEKTSLYISEFGLYQLLTTSKLKNPIINEFQDLLFEEILPSIRKTGKYEIPNLFSNIKSFYNDNMITPFVDKKVVYIGITSNIVVNNGIVEVLAKFGKTGGIIERDIEKHRNFFDDFKVVFIRECDNYEDIERLFKLELKALNLHRKVEIKGVTCNELFTVKEDYTMDNVINMLNKLIVDNPLKSIEDKNNKIKELENNLELKKLRSIHEFEIKKMELEIKKLELELKLKDKNRN